MTLIGNPRWRAPEVTRGERYADTVDVYGYALIVYELLTGLLPFHEHEAMPACHEAARGRRPAVPTNVEPEWQQLLRECWDDVPSRRPSFAAIRKRLDSGMPIVQPAVKESPKLADLSTYGLSNPSLHSPSNHYETEMEYST
jgi:serine/threonine protein kinase